MEKPDGAIGDAYQLGNRELTAGELKNVFETRLEMTSGMSSRTTR